MLEDSGAPAMVTRALIAPPQSRVGPITDAELRKSRIPARSRANMTQTVDRESAFEILQARAQGRTSGAPVGADAPKKAGCCRDRLRPRRSVPPQGKTHVGGASRPALGGDVGRAQRWQRPSHARFFRGITGGMK